MRVVRHQSTVWFVGVSGTSPGVVRDQSGLVSAAPDARYGGGATTTF